MIRAVYPGTFDPLTRGHEDLVRRAAKLFDTLILGVADSTAKRTFFTNQERVEMAREVLGDLKNVQVVGFSGLLIEFVRQQGAQVALRGLRAVSDFEYEFQMAGMNARLDPNIETVFLMASDRHHFISSRFVKEIGRLGGDVGSFVTPRVAVHIAARLEQERRSGGAPDTDS